MKNHPKISAGEVEKIVNGAMDRAIARGVKGTNALVEAAMTDPQVVEHRGGDMKSEKRNVSLDVIRADDRTQPRAALLPDRMAEYVEDMSRGDKFPPPVVFQDKQRRYWLADGFHRYHAAVGLELRTIECVVYAGELRDAILYSCGANAAHGLRRTNADKRQAVTKLLNDDEWAAWSDREIARQCHVNEHLVARLRKDLEPVHLRELADKPRTVSRGGTTYTQNTAAIGKPSRQPDSPELPLASELPPQVTKDIENGFISSALWEIERQINSLPPPAEAAERFPTHHHHTFTAAKLRRMANWLAGFADAWPNKKESSDGETRTAA